MPSQPPQSQQTQTIAPAADASERPAEPDTERETQRNSERERDPEPDDTSRLLRLILQELRHQRGEETGLSNLTVVAIVLQMIAGLCLLGGLWMGMQSDALFERWIGAGIILQLATIAMLLFARQRL
jgi:hypothetical protein